MSSQDVSDRQRTARLEELRLQFTATLGQRVDAIAAHAAALRVGAWPAAAGEDFLSQVHTLAGSAGLFGLDRIGEAAAVLERFLVDLRRRQTTTAVDLAAVRDAAQRLSTAYATARV